MMVQTVPQESLVHYEENQMNNTSTRNFPLFSNRQIFEMSDYELQETINNFQSYIRRERKLNRDTKEAEIECAYLMQERDERTRS